MPVLDTVVLFAAADSTGPKHEKACIHGKATGGGLRSFMPSPSGV